MNIKHNMKGGKKCRGKGEERFGGRAGPKLKRELTLSFFKVAYVIIIIIPKFIVAVIVIVCSSFS